MAGNALTLERAVALLRSHHGSPPGPPTSDPFELILWENVAYLASPERRREAFDDLRKSIGTSPKAILSSRPRDLERVTARGILATTFAEKLRECARIAIDQFDGDVGAVLEEPPAKAKRRLRAFPGIGEPGAEKILLFAGGHPSLAPESNGLRVLFRLGLVAEEKPYARAYAAGREAGTRLGENPKLLQEAHLLLHLHGRTLCRRAAPRCEACPLERGCAHAAREGRAGRSAGRGKRK